MLCITYQKVKCKCSFLSVLYERRFYSTIPFKRNSQSETWYELKGWKDSRRMSATFLRYAKISQEPKKQSGLRVIYTFVVKTGVYSADGLMS